MDFILPLNMAWIWLSLAIVFIIIEALTFSVITVWFAVGSFIMVFLSFLQIPFTLQILIFLAISIVLLILTRPLVLKRLETKKQKTNVDSLTGMTALVTKDILPFDKGEIKVNGVFWTAKAESNETIEKEAECVILRIEGVTAIVEKKTY